MIVPVYNEAETIEAILARVEAAAPAIRKEIVVCNDGSTDGTSELLRAAAAVGRIVLVDSAVNRGKGAAIRAGLDAARGSIVIIQDADLEMDPGEYPLLLQPILDGRTDVVYGSRLMRRSVLAGPLLTTLANRFLTAMTNLLYGSQLTDVETCYKVFRREALARIRLTCDRFDFEPEVSGKLLRAGISILEVPISYAPRSRAQGKKIRWRDGIDALLVLIRCRFIPMSSILATS